MRKDVPIMNLDKTISAIILIIIIAGVIGVLYIVINPAPGEKFTEFYILGADGKAGNYPSNLNAGQVGTLIVGVVNREQATTSYNLVIKINGNILKQEKITLKNGEKREELFKFTAGPPGKQRVDFYLYKLPDTKKVYRYLFLLVNVK
jgi:uncharacterized membrane protein